MLLTTLPADWKMAGVADFNSVGKPDVIWTNTLIGDRSIWLMNGTSLLSGGYLDNVPIAWRIAH